MKKRIIKLNKNADGSIPYLSSIIEEIPTNTIICKTLTGLGATYSECKAKRHSIIIEPNLPVIIGKCNSEVHKEDGLFGVYKGVRKDHISYYINNQIQDGKYIKIMTTPESFMRVQMAIHECDMDIMTDFFLLFDECHKVIQDNDYRNTVTLPFDTFFSCENKALVSATPLEFSDPRFEVNGFTEIVVEPDFDYSQEVKLVMTDNICVATQVALDIKVDEELVNARNSLYPEKGREDAVYFIFCNSLCFIKSAIRELGIQNESKIYCSHNSCEDLSRNGYTNYSENWDSQYAKYNFFTSRFYNAFDIELDIKPNVIMVSDGTICVPSLLAPATDVRQIIGRFRNGVDSVVHVFTINLDFPSRTRKDIKEYVDSQQMIYLDIHTRWENATTQESANAFCDACESMLPHCWHKWVDDVVYENSFAIDNYIEDQYLISTYSDLDWFLREYEKEKGIKIAFLMPIFKKDPYKIQKNKTLNEHRKEIVEQLALLGDCESEFDRRVKEDLRNVDSFIVEAYELLGRETIEKLQYSRKKINEAMILAHAEERLRGDEILRCIRNSFIVGQWYSVDFIKKELKRIYKLFNIVSPKAITSRSIKDFFIVKESKRKNVRGYVIERCNI